MKILSIQSDPFYQLTYRTAGHGPNRGKAVITTLPFYKIKVDKMPDGINTFVVTSDLQGREENKINNRLVGEAVADELALLQELGEIPQIDLVLLAGDLYDHPDCGKLGGTGIVTSVWNAFADKFEQVIGVHGNHDIVEDNLLKSNVKILDGKEIN